MAGWIPYRGQVCNFKGLYAIILDGAVAYIGQSQDVGRRLASHSLGISAASGLFRGVKFSDLRVRVRATKDSECRHDLEAKLIARLNPSINVKGAAKPAKDARALPSSSGEVPYVHLMHLEYG